MVGEGMGERGDGGSRGSAGLARRLRRKTRQKDDGRGISLLVREGGKEVRTFPWTRPRLENEKVGNGTREGLVH